MRRLPHCLLWFALLLAFVPHPACAVQGVDEWTSCAADRDCVVVGSICPNFYWAINRDFAFANSARNQELRGTLDCAPSFQPRPRRAQCVRGQCQLPLNQTASQNLSKNQRSK